MPNPDHRRALIAIVVCFGAVFVMSQFYRSVNAVIAKTLEREFLLSPEELGVLTGGFFLSFAAAQIPVGMLFDRFGARRTVPVILCLAIAGSLLYALSSGFGGLLAGRVLQGFGVSGVLMGSLFLFGRWAEPADFSTWMGRMIAIGGAGGLIATTPLAMIDTTLGWRVALWGAAIVTAFGAIAIYAIVRDGPSGRRVPERAPETVGQSIAGVRAVLTVRGLPALFGMGLASYPVVITVLGLWGGPYLIDVHGLDSVAAGNGLLLMAVSLIIANLVLGPLERRLDTRKHLVAVCAGVIIVAFVLLAVLPELGLIPALLLFAVIGACGSYNIILAGQARALFPDHLAGRGMALMAIAFMGGPAIMQSLAGVIIGAFPPEGGAPPLIAYRALFGFLAAVVAVMLIGYLRVPDVRPSAGFVADAVEPKA